MPLPPCLPSVFPFMISILGCSWLVPPCLPSFSPFMISFLGCSWLPSPKLVSLHDSLSPFMISLLGCSWLPLPLCLPSLSSLLGLVSQLVSLHDFHSGAALHFRCRLVSQLVSLDDFPSGLLLAAAAALSHSLSPFMIFLLCCFWLLLPPCYRCRRCLPSLSPFLISLPEE